MELPEDIVARILSKLHPFDAVKAKLVCRAWRRVISNFCVFSSVLGFAIEWPFPSPTLLYADLSRSRWVSLPLLAEPASLLAIANPFLCLSTTASSQPHLTQLYLVNPLTRALVCIPPPLSRPAPFLVGLYTGPLIRGFKIVIAWQKAIAERNRQSGMLDLPVQIFDSVGNLWRMAGSVAVAVPEYASPVCVGHQIYWLSRRFRRHVLVFDAIDESWSSLGASWPHMLSLFTLWEWDGNLYMAGELSNALTVWKLAMDRCEWLIHTHIPASAVHVDHFCGVKDVAGHGHLLCIMLVGVGKGVVYDLRSHSTSWLPFCPVSSYSWGNVHPYMLGFSDL